MPWVSPLLALPKPGHDGKAFTDTSQIRLVADSTVSNTAIMREHRAIITPEELGLEANGSDEFSVVDIIESYSQIEIAEESTSWKDYKKKDSQSPKGNHSSSFPKLNSLVSSFQKTESK